MGHNSNSKMIFCNSAHMPESVKTYKYLDTLEDDNRKQSGWKIKCQEWKKHTHTQRNRKFEESVKRLKTMFSYLTFFILFSQVVNSCTNIFPVKMRLVPYFPRANKTHDQWALTISTCALFKSIEILYGMYLYGRHSEAQKDGVPNTCDVRYLPVCHSTFSSNCDVAGDREGSKNEVRFHFPIVCCWTKKDNFPKRSFISEEPCYRTKLMESVKM